MAISRRKIKYATIGYGSIFLGVLIFSTMEVVSKIATASSPHLDAFWLSTTRFIISGVVFIPALFYGPKISSKDLMGMCSCSILAITLSMTCFYQVALMPYFNLNAGIAAVLFCSAPIFVVLLSPFISPESKPKTVNLKGAFLALFGVIIASWHAINGIKASCIGILLVIIAAVLFAAQAPHARVYVKKYGGLKFIAVLLLFGGISSLLISIFLKGIPPLGQFTTHWFALTYYGLIGTGLGYFFYFYGFKLVYAERSSQLLFLKPIMAPIFAFFILGEPLYSSLILGVVIILFGMGFALHPKMLDNINPFTQRGLPKNLAIGNRRLNHK